MRQILYASAASDAVTGIVAEQILQTSRLNNSLDGIKGILWSNGRRFVEIFEGPRAVVAETFARLQRDQRHHSIAVLSDRITAKPEFALWTMAYCPIGDFSSYGAQIQHALIHVPTDIRALFLDAMSDSLPLPPTQLAQVALPRASN